MSNNLSRIVKCEYFFAIMSIPFCLLFSYVYILN